MTTRFLPQTSPALKSFPRGFADAYPFGGINVYLDAETGAYLGAVDKASGEGAESVYRPAYVTQAKNQARNAWESRAER